MARCGWCDNGAPKEDDAEEAAESRDGFEWIWEPTPSADAAALLTVAYDVTASPTTNANDEPALAAAVTESGDCDTDMSFAVCLFADDRGVCPSIAALFFIPIARGF